MLRRGILPGLLIALSSCITVEAPSTTTVSAAPSAPTVITTTIPATTTSSAPPIVVTTTRPSTPNIRPIPPCLSPEPLFGSTGEIDRYVPAGSDSALLASIDWHLWEECERFVFSLASTEGAPTLIPPTVALVFFENQRVLRLQMGPEIETSAVAHQLIESPLVEDLYVVRSSDGGLTVDLHLAEPVAARLIPSSTPATLTVDLRPESTPFSQPPVIAPRAVLFLPREETLQYPFTVNGYLQPGIEESVATLTDAAGSTTESRFPLAGADDVWSSFAAVFLEGSPGWVTLEVEGARASLFFGE